MNGINSESALALSRGGVELGRSMFRSFLLAGERHVVAGLSRPGTDEERVAKLLGSLPREVTGPMEGYFRRQASLSLSQRAQVLGTLTNLSISEPLTLATTSRPLMSMTAIRTELAPLFPGGLVGPVTLIRRPTSGIGVAQPPPKPGLLRLRIEQITVAESQDDYRVWFPFYGWETYNTTDEVNIAVVGIDETGNVASVTHSLGNLGEGRTKSFTGMDLFSFSVVEGGEKYPKIYSCQIHAVEGDAGGWNRLIAAATDYAKSKSEEMVASAIVSGSAVAGAPIPPTLASMIASAVDSYVDDFIDWLGSLLRNDDDVLGTVIRAATVRNDDFTWGEGLGPKSPSWSASFHGADGLWTAKFHWLLEPTQATESPLTQAS